VKELLTVMTRKGQVTVPAEVRKALDLKQGDKVAFELPEGAVGTVAIRRVGSVAEQTFGALASAVPALSPQEERAAFEEGTAEEVEAETPRVQNPR
jgi:AbrB family looped-hinge helix DNA binding protein